MPPERPGWTFYGWFTEEDGAGTKYYNDDCTLALSLDEYAVVGDLTLYASWTLTDPTAADTIAINGVGLTGGVTQTGDGWHYDGSTGYVQLITEGKRYVVTGKDPAGEFSLFTYNTCTVVMSNLTINASANASRSPLETKEGTSSTLLFEGTNTLYGPKDYPAIFIQRNTTLTIGECDGQVTATGGKNAPGIGGACGTISGTLNIQGGTIIAKGGENGAGIGAAYQSGFGAVNITGGKVTAFGGDRGAGIGSGYKSTNFSVEISGGTVTAQSGSNGAGIGGGYHAKTGAVKISGGVVTAKVIEGYGAAIGAGGCIGVNFTTGITVDISGGLVTAKGHYSSGIGPGYWTTCGAIAISGGTIYASTDISGAKPIGKDRETSAESVTITGGAIYVDNGDIDPAPKDGYGTNVFPVDLDIGLPLSKVTMFELDTRQSGFENIYTNDKGILRIWLASSVYTYGIIVEMEDGSKHYFCFSIDETGKVTVRDYIVVNGMIVPGGNDSYGTGWDYKADTSVMTLTDDTTLEGISTNGEFRIVVADDAVKNLTLQNLKLVARNEKDASAVAVSNTACTVTLVGDNVLTGRGQYAAGLGIVSNCVLTVKGAGSLAATGGKNAAGIGSCGGFPAPGKILIEFGTITAQGGEKAAGIGGGVSSPLDKEDNIVISGGYVTAIGGKNAAGIGAGQGKATLAAGAVRIAGGTVVATGNTTSGSTGGLTGSASWSDLVKSDGNTLETTGNDYTLRIDGGSVIGTNGRVSPRPVDANSNLLYAVTISGLTPGTQPSISSFSGEIPASYNLTGIRVNDEGEISLWLPPTNLTRIIQVDGKYIKAEYPYSASAYLPLYREDVTIDAASGASDTPPEEVVVDDETLQLVKLTGFDPGAAVDFEGLPGYYGTECTYADEQGYAYLWLPDGDYEITSAQGGCWSVSVAGSDIEATVIQVESPQTTQNITITNFSISGGKVTLGVSNGEVALRGAKSSSSLGDIKIRVSSSLPMTDENSKLVEPKITDNGDGTYTVTVPEEDAEQRFFRIEKE